MLIMAKKTFKKVEKASFGKMASFLNPGDKVEGKLVKLSKGETPFGEAEFLHLADEAGEETSVCISANLKGYDWQSFIGSEVQISYTGNERNPETKRTYKVYDVAVAE